MLVHDVVVHVQREPEREVAERHARGRELINIKPGALSHGRGAALQRHELLNQCDLVSLVLVVVGHGRRRAVPCAAAAAQLEGMRDGGGSHLGPVVG